MSNERPDEGRSGTDEIIELIKEQAAAEPEFSYRDYHIEDYIALAFFWFLSLVVFSQFFTRYFLGFSMPWTEEGARYLLVCVTFTGSIMAVRRNSHIFVEFLYRYLPRKVGRAFISFVDLSRVVFMIIGLWLGYRIIPITMRRYLVTMRIPLGWIYLVVTVGFALMLVWSVVLAYRHWRDAYVPSCREDRIGAESESKGGGST